MNLTHTLRHSGAPPMAEDLIDLAVRAWHAEHPDTAYCGGEYPLGVHEFLALVERLYCARHPHRLCETGCAWEDDLWPILDSAERGEHIVYTAWDCEEPNHAGARTLYVGVTSDFPARMRSHMKQSVWWRFAARVTVERFETREIAESIESDWIFSARPPFNLVGKS